MLIIRNGGVYIRAIRRVAHGGMEPWVWTFFERVFYQELLYHSLIWKSCKILWDLFFSLNNSEMIVGSKMRYVHGIV